MQGVSGAGHEACGKEAQAEEAEVVQGEVGVMELKIRAYRPENLPRVHLVVSADHMGLDFFISTENAEQLADELLQAVKEYHPVRSSADMNRAFVEGVSREGVHI